MINKIQIHYNTTILLLINIQRQTDRQTDRQSVSQTDRDRERDYKILSARYIWKPFDRPTKLSLFLHYSLSDSVDG